MAQTPAVKGLPPDVMYVPVQMPKAVKSEHKDEALVEHAAGSSFLDSVAKVTFLAASLYGVYLWGYLTAVDKASKAFEDFLSPKISMDSRSLPTGTEGNITRMGSWVWSRATDLQYAKEGGAAFRKYLIENMSGRDALNTLSRGLKVVGPHIQHAWNVTKETVASATGSARDVVHDAAAWTADTAVKSTAAFGVGAGGTYWGLNLVSSMPSKLVKVAVELYKYSPLPGAHKLRQVN